MVLSADQASTRLQKTIAIALLGLGLASPIRASSAEPLLAQCITVESGNRPWLEKTLWGLRDQEGGWVGAEITNADGSADLGPMQINSSWVPRIALLIHRSRNDVRAWLTHDTCFNVRTAAWIFLTALAATKDYWQAVGLYHSPTAWRRRHYAGAVAAKIGRRYGTKAFATGRKSDMVVAALQQK